MTYDGLLALTTMTTIINTIMAKTTAATAPATMAMGKSSSGTEKIKNEIRLSAKHLIG